MTLQEIDKLPLQEIVAFYKEYYPNKHFTTTEDQLRYKVESMVARLGALNAKQAQLLKIPFTGRIYSSEGGNLSATMAHEAIDVMPGASEMTFLESL